MKPDEIIMYCRKLNHRGCGQWVKFDREIVNVVFSLQTHEYQFTAKCPKCATPVYNTVRMR